MKDNKYLVQKINEISSSLYSDFFRLEIIEESQQLPNYEESINEIFEVSNIKDSIKYKFKSLYNLICVYLETNELLNYLESFKKDFLSNLDNDKLIYQTEINPDDTIGYSVFLSKFYQYLIPFEFINHRFLNHEGLIYLENVLNNTQVILNNNNCIPTSETEVYNNVKNILNVIFPSSIEAKSNFIKSFKCFKPDILIPEIKTAIEYKYADSRNKLKNLIEQVYADVQGYTGDKDYEIFYAVFYVTEDFWGKKKFDNAWKEFNFPDNWKAIYIVGTK